MFWNFAYDFNLIKFRQSQVIFKIGDSIDYVYIVKEGQIDVNITLLIKPF